MFSGEFELSLEQMSIPIWDGGGRNTGSLRQEIQTGFLLIYYGLTFHKALSVQIQFKLR
jgi:hypothetical protein